MAILIKGMEMQETCVDCPCVKDDGFYFFFCGVTKQECDWMKLPESCPLIEVPEPRQIMPGAALEAAGFEL